MLPNPCCCANCRAAFDDFERESIGADWSEDAGTWAIVGGELTTSSDNALIKYVPGTIGADFYLKFKGSDGDELLLSDDSPIAGRPYMVITVGAAGKLSVYDTSGAMYHECDINIPADEWVTLRVKCASIVYINGVEVFQMGVPGFTPIVLGTLNISGTVYFNDYEQRYVYDEISYPNCPPCGGDCRWFPNGKVQPLTFRIVGATDYFNGTFWIYYSRLNGEYEAAELNTPLGCFVQVSGLGIQIVDDPGNEVVIDAINVSLGIPQITVVTDAPSNYYTYDKYTSDPGDFCRGSTLVLPDNGPSLTEVGTAEIDIP